jgi:hypothetical protein
VILSAEEMVRFFAAVPSLKHRTALMAACAAGLGVSEVVRLRIVDIDCDRMLIRVEQGKGHRNRYVMLSVQLLVPPIGGKIGRNTGRFGPQRGPAVWREHASGGAPECPQSGEARQTRACTALPPTSSKPAPLFELPRPIARAASRGLTQPGFNGVALGGAVIYRRSRETPQKP